MMHMYESPINVMQCEYYKLYARTRGRYYIAYVYALHRYLLVSLSILSCSIYRYIINIG